MTVRTLLERLMWNPDDPDYPIVIKGAGSLNGIYYDLEDDCEGDALILKSIVWDWYIAENYLHRNCCVKHLVIDLCEQ